MTFDMFSYSLFLKRQAPQQHPPRFHRRRVLEAPQKNKIIICIEPGHRGIPPREKQQHLAMTGALGKRKQSVQLQHVPKARIPLRSKFSHVGPGSQAKTNLEPSNNLLREVNIPPCSPSGALTQSKSRAKQCRAKPSKAKQCNAMQSNANQRSTHKFIHNT